MINTIEDINSTKLEVQIVPKLREFNFLSLEPGDTLVAYYDRNHYTMDEVQNIYELLRKAFPNNNILCIEKHVNLGVIKENDKRTKTLL